MKTLVVVTHPLKTSLCQYLAKNVIEHLEKQGHEVTVKDLYQENFEPALSESERGSYYSQNFQPEQTADDIRQLEETEYLVLVFPTWWFNFPAILKGWFDRVWVPGHAYNHSPDMKAITPNLDKLKKVTAVTTLGAPWWVDRFVLRRPVYKILKYALLEACASKCKFKMHSLYQSEIVSPDKVEQFLKQVKRTL
ncbi:putative Flavoprotein [Vibrio nigripulchritudo SO65]|uniref:NAD(P)H-dependent oxidoreductase n=1 Tax=Vibrio nigripulchritudo TaxID=28173 RepID=UPI0003B21F0B|nr:NAD(P)H-dependent oxidoreductase [Vibrio nigripulchritudo]CCN33964.1 putative Flavoprotein [Vibrio nigripulchritudo AM115]CCN42247.1 putative Flavoprotein [Vibrio nigripulchritudo FTn2]CCN65872.1 putative Flavoprotein [Vibrio nigripulchritudo POn4]CCN68492.1 putative Flavoprotein [Vibrio nigripulchritudo SFn118]CCN75880.1 putative Flavoprotein [Vibrio nigripulchritudo SO65]